MPSSEGIAKLYLVVGLAGGGKDRHVTFRAGAVFGGAEKGDVAAGFGHAIALMEVDVEPGERTAQQIGWDRGGAVGDVPQRR